MSIHSRIDSALRTAKTWENDPLLLAEIRASIPFVDLLCGEECAVEVAWRQLTADEAGAVDAAEIKRDESTTIIKCSKDLFRDDDAEFEGDDLLLKRLTLYFKQDVMKWVNQPPCSNPNCTGNEDGKQMTSKGVRGPVSDEEKNRAASRVEMYTCQLCNNDTTFPRYNYPRALFQSRRGRCGEFANLFGTYCRAIGFDTRYVLDFTDHVWTEVWSVRQQRWLHADSCEGLIDRPSMYEQGWGKKLNYAIGATHDSVADVTKRYTRKFFTDEFQARRREYCPDENTSDRAFMQMSSTVKQMSNIGKGRLDELEKRAKAEEKFFGMVQSSGVWDTEYKEGRISGSFMWKAARSELGEQTAHSANETKAKRDEEVPEIHSYVVESFNPSPHQQNEVVIVVRPDAGRKGIVVNGVPCAATLTKGVNGVSAVTVDELSGCILQSCAFVSWSAAATYLDSVPDGRIVALRAVFDGAIDSIDNVTAEYLGRLGGVDANDKTMFIGQIGFNPTWAMCLNADDGTKAIKVSIQIDTTPSVKIKLRSEHDTTPTIVATRLPESIMPLKTQLVASAYQKRVAFEAFMEKKSDTSLSIVGYTTRPEAPVYLIDREAFPFRRAAGHSHGTSSSWTTYHYLPERLVPDDDFVSEEDGTDISAKNRVHTFDVPVTDYFGQLVGDSLLVMTGGGATTTLDTISALSNTRLVALYFSAHWCGPCRSFTPMLSEFYSYLKEEFPRHGLEVIFVSSDRDDAQFQQYYRTMPFMALPFSNRHLAQHLKSVFGVRGIPSLVVLDSISGRIVVSPEDSRRDVHQACQRGERAIEQLFKTWLEKIPEESKSMLDILRLSCEEADRDNDVDSKESASKINTKTNEYLVRRKQPSGLSSKEESSALVKDIFARLVATGMEPNAAAVEAIKQASAEQSAATPGMSKLAKGTLQGISEQVTSKSVGIVGTEALMNRSLSSEDRAAVATAITTAKKYVANVQKDPSNPRFRTFRISNKVFDQITTVPGSIQLLTNVGFTVFHTDIDFVASIPLSVDLSMMNKVLDRVVAFYRT